MKTIPGNGVSAGIAMGPLRFFRREIQTVVRWQVTEREAERDRFAAAQNQAMAELGALAEKARKETGEEAALLFETHQMMAEDPDYVETIEGLIRGGLNAEAAVSDAGEQFAEMFSAMDDSYMQARASDVKDISRRMIGILQGTETNVLSGGPPAILAADDLSPSETVQLDRKNLLGFVTAGGSPSGHTAILARAMGIPAVIGAGDLEPAWEGREVILDGDSGALILEPDAPTRAAFLEKQTRQRKEKQALSRLKGQENITLDGRKIQIFCNIGSPADINIGSPADIAAVKENDGGGVGLFRSEFLYLAAQNYPTEEELFAAYRDAVSAMEGKTVIIRTLDIGADKQVPYFGLEKEENPAMGLRALRICLRRPEIFRTQLRALYRASAYGKMGIMFPMIASLWELRDCREICRSVQRELQEEHIPFDPEVELGVMIETPAAVWVSQELAREADFFSIGTNDLSQYILACDRQNPNLGRFYDPHHPAVLRAIQTTVENAHRQGKWVGICGELAGDPELTELFLSMGVDELSVTPDKVLPLRKRVRETDVGNVRKKQLSRWLSGSSAETEEALFV